MVLFSGDGDFRSLVEAMQRRGVKVTVISTIQTQPAMIADDLRRQADKFADLADFILEDRARSRVNVQRGHRVTMAVRPETTGTVPRAEIRASRLDTGIRQSVSADDPAEV